jgi:hypothetical protein
MQVKNVLECFVNTKFINSYILKYLRINIIRKFFEYASSLLDQNPVKLFFKSIFAIQSRVHIQNASFSS